MHLLVSGSTHVGRRTNNEDALCRADELGLFVVADGMGGYEGGEIASSLTVEAMRDFVAANRRDPEGTWPVRANHARTFEENLLDAAIVFAHRKIVSQRTERLGRMGSTVVAALVSGRRLVVAHVGDSRLYRLRDGALSALTRDHSYFAELEAQGWAGDRKSFPYKNQITRALGIDGASAADVATWDVKERDVFLLCTDGLYDPIDEPALAAALALTPDEACSRLTELALQAGGTDNITGLVLRACADEA
jgi:serine/threonine protein phosphatase PrpC